MVLYGPGYEQSCPIVFPGPKPMQDGWGSGGEEIGMNTSQWDADDGDMWNSPTSQDSSCNSWGQSKKAPQRVTEAIQSHQYSVL